jgi:hypothetical protein
MAIEKLYLLFSGVGCAIFGTYLLCSRMNLYVNGKRTVGRVLDWEPRGRKVFFHPVVEFTTMDGEKYKFTSYTGYSKKPEIEHYPVVYLRREPAKALIYSVLHFWIPPLLLLAMSAGPLFLLFKR